MVFYTIYNNMSLAKNPSEGCCNISNTSSFSSSYLSMLIRLCYSISSVGEYRHRITMATLPRGPQHGWVYFLAQLLYWLNKYEQPLKCSIPNNWIRVLRSMERSGHVCRFVSLIQASWLSPHSPEQLNVGFKCLPGIYFFVYPQHMFCSFHPMPNFLPVSRPLP